MLEMKIISVKSEASREKSIPFNIKEPLPDEHTNHNSKLEAFVRLELSRKAAVELIVMLKGRKQWMRNFENSEVPAIIPADFI
mgnify:CR=1 FL=1